MEQLKNVTMCPDVDHLQAVGWDKCHPSNEVCHVVRSNQIGEFVQVRTSFHFVPFTDTIWKGLAASYRQQRTRTMYQLRKLFAHRRPRIGFDGMAICGVVVFAAYTLINAHYETDIGDAESAVNASIPAQKRNYITKELVRTLNRDGVVVIKDVLLESELASARTAALDVFSQGRLNFAGGNSISVRQDKVCFVRGNDGTEGGADEEARAHTPIGVGLQHCISLLRGTTQRLQELGYNRSTNHKVPMQCQLAHYAGNGNSSYTAHRDAASDTNFYEIGLLAW